MSAVETIKNFCKLLSAYNVTQITANYDGSGDSGDFDGITVRQLPTPAQIDRAAANTSNPGGLTLEATTTSWSTFKRQLSSDPNGLITAKHLENFEEALFDLLPSGWEIDSGSYGEIHVTIADETIQVEHNERIEEVRSETFNY